MYAGFMPLIKRVLGIDPSLTATGLAVLEVLPSGGHRWITLESVKNPRLRGHARIEAIRARLRAALEATSEGDLVVMEGPSFGSRGPGHHEIAGLWWILRHDIYSLQPRVGQRHVAIVPPKSRALYATGSGNADKIAVREAMQARFPEAVIVDDNVADAMTFATMGARALSRAVDTVESAQLAAMGKVVWPDGL